MNTETVTFTFFGLTILLSLLTSTRLTTTPSVTLIDQKKVKNKFSDGLLLLKEMPTWWSLFNSAFLFTGITCQAHLFDAHWQL
jgi:hypothetical protein